MESPNVIQHDSSLYLYICIYSGHGIGGTALLVINSFIATAAMFGGGMGMHAAMKKGMI